MDARHRVLLAKIDPWGDTLLGTPLVRGLLREHPGSLVVWILRAGNEGLSSLLPGCHVFRPDFERPAAEEASRLLTEAAAAETGDPWSGLVMIPYVRPADHVSETIDEFRARFVYWREFLGELRFTCGLAQSHWRERALLALSQAPERIAVVDPLELSDLDWYRWQVSGITVEERSLTQAVPRHKQENELEIMEKLLAKAVGTQVELHFRLPPAEVARFTDASHAPRGILISPGNSTSDRAWPEERFAELALLLRDEFPNQPISFLFGPMEAVVAERIWERLGGRAGEFRRLEGDFPTVARILTSSQLVVASDSLVRHLTQLLGVPSVVLQGGGHPTRFTMRDSPSMIVFQDLACAACHWRCIFDRHRCIKDLPLSAVLAAVRDMLAAPVSKPVQRLVEPLTSTAEIVDAMKERHLAATAALNAKEREIIALNYTCEDRLQTINSLDAKLQRARESKKNGGSAM